MWNQVFNLPQLLSAHQTLFLAARARGRQSEKVKRQQTSVYLNRRFPGHPAGGEQRESPASPAVLTLIRLSCPDWTFALELALLQCKHFALYFSSPQCTCCHEKFRSTPWSPRPLLTASSGGTEAAVLQPRHDIQGIWIKYSSTKYLFRLWEWGKIHFRQALKLFWGVNTLCMWLVPPFARLHLPWKKMDGWILKEWLRQTVSILKNKIKTKMAKIYTEPCVRLCSRYSSWYRCRFNARGNPRPLLNTESVFECQIQCLPTWFC